MISAFEEEGKPEYAHFAKKLMLHGQTEEVLYPAAILVGEYLRLRSALLFDNNCEYVINYTYQLLFHFCNFQHQISFQQFFLPRLEV
jgi:hypothetical protein